MPNETVYLSGTGYKTIILKFHQRKRGLKYVIGETVLKVVPEYVWLWVAIEVESKEIFGIRISRERNICVTERFISSLIKHYDGHPISTDGGTWYPKRAHF